MTDQELHDASKGYFEAILNALPQEIVDSVAASTNEDYAYAFSTGHYILQSLRRLPEGDARMFFTYVFNRLFTWAWLSGQNSLMPETPEITNRKPS